MVESASGLRTIILALLADAKRTPTRLQMTHEVDGWHPSVTSEASGHGWLLDGVVVCPMVVLLIPQVELKIALFLLFLLFCPQEELGLLKSIQMM